MTSDTADDLLLELLRQDARQSTAELARKLGVARSTVQSRIERLERTGVIAGYTLKPGTARGDRRVSAHVMIAVAPQQQAAVERKLRAVRGVKSLLTVSGTYDFIAVVTADTTDELDVWLDELRACDGVQQTLSSIVLSTKLER